MARDSDSFTILVQSIYVAAGLPRPVDALAQLKADAKALADVRACEAWEDNHPTMGTIHIAKCTDGFTAHIYDDFHAVLIVPGLPAATRDAARAKAAEWVRKQEQGALAYDDATEAERAAIIESTTTEGLK